ncbi:hypothetical protein [Streptomyces alkaliterrae]|uniref:Uncharacterized protein n=1 Tax=Streptomyces alkaliterrae TaxID=2213162 RepID=A0A5P0YU19_9ACTN|nr:hypothetical protein [Streptomyces alkaliterrae]MBB1252178.1 hypothetical protein [Streptomyces alkaliterrae]MBB1258573.1 hypothetical protein [Streptomyces alkaliterrae]MQS02942.1 hypothetical protein [Streptomyces alkaliterrae]
MIDMLLRLYPATYRRTYGPEIADVYRESTRGASAPTRLREAAGIVGHAVRLRLGLGSAGSLGALLKIAAPYAMVAAAVATALRFGWWLSGIWVGWEAHGAGAFPFTSLELGVADGLLAATHLLVMVGAVTAFSGRWAAGARLTVAGLLASTLAMVLFQGVHNDPVVLSTAAALLAAGVIWACPPDAPPAPAATRTAGVVALVAWLPPAAVHSGLLAVTTDYGAWPLLVLAVTGCVLAVRAGSNGVRELTAMALACAPLAALSHWMWAGQPGPVLAGLALLPLAVLPAAAVRVLRRPRASAD